MELSSLRAPRPMAPRLSAGDKRVHIILRDLEKIKMSRPKKRVKRCQNLIFYITNTIRKAEDDHLLHATAVWALINIFRLHPVETKSTMLEAGVPGILYDVIKNSSISGTSRQYASELCFYLSSNNPYPTGKELPASGGPISSFPQIEVVNRYNGELDDVSVVSSMSSQLDNQDNDTVARADRQPFVPYRINDSNLSKIEALFHPEDGNGALAEQLVASLPHHQLLSQFGFSQYKNKRAADMNYYSQLKEMRVDMRKLRQNKSQGEDDDDDDSDSEHSSDNDIFGNLSARDDDEQHEDEDDPLTARSSSRRGAHREQLSPHKRIRIKSGDDDDDDDVSVVSSISSGSRSHTRSVPSLSRDNSHKNFLDASAARSNSHQDEIFLALHGGHQGAHFARSQLQGSLRSPQRQGGDRRALTSQSCHSAERKRPHTTSAPGSPFRLGKLQKADGSQQSSFSDDEEHSVAKTGANAQPISTAPHRAIQQLRASTTGNSAYDSWTSQFKTREVNQSLGETAVRAPTLITSRKPLQKFSDSCGMGQNGGLAVQNTSSWIDGSTDDVSISSAVRRSANSQTMLASFAGPKSDRPSSSFLDDFMRDLDPLSLNVQSTTIAPKTRLTEDVERDEYVDDDGADYWDEDDDTAEQPSRMRIGESIDTTGGADQLLESANDGEHSNPFVAQRRMRMRAEKLIDHKFVHALFLKKATFAQSQDLIHRIEQLLTLLDKDHTGYITFEEFTRLILAIAPKHLLRGDIEAFFQAQSDSLQDLVDYREFVISGKVLLLTKAQLLQKNREREQEELKKKQRDDARRLQSLSGAKEDRALDRRTQQQVKDAFAHRSETSSTAVWLKRQREYVGNPSTYTWKQHLKWYSTRKAQAVIWLVRRATRAFDHEQRLLEAQRFLSHTIRRQAFAISDLMDSGHAALFAKEKRLNAKRRLLSRVIHAREHIQRTVSAKFYLEMFAKGAKKEADLVHKYKLMLEQSRKDRKERDEELEKSEEAKLYKTVVTDQLVKKKQANYANFFKVRELQKLAIAFLRSRGDFAKQVVGRQAESLEFLQRNAHRVIVQLAARDRAQRELIQRAEASLAFCLAQDQAILYLRRRSERAVALANRKDSNVEWLTDFATVAGKFLSSQSVVWQSLCATGRHTLSFMNERERAFAKLVARTEKAHLLLEKRREAEQFLLRAPERLFRVYEGMDQSIEWLQARAERARAHALRQAQARHYLSMASGKASRTYRRLNIAHQELVQIGLLARVDFFRVIHKQEPALVQLVSAERARIAKEDKETEAHRRSWAPAVRLKAELAEAIELLHSVFTPLSLTRKTHAQNIESVARESLAVSQSQKTSPMKKSKSKAKLENTKSQTPLAIASREPSTALVPAHSQSAIARVESTQRMVTFQPADSQQQLVPQALSTAAGSRPRLKKPKFFVGKFAFRKLAQNGKLFNVDVVALDEAFRNADYNTSCYIDLAEASRLFEHFVAQYQKKNKVDPIKTPFVFRVASALPVEERALISVFLRLLHDKELIELTEKSQKKKKRGNRFEEAMNLYGEGRRTKSNVYESDEESDEEEEEEDIDEDELFSDISKLQNCDIGRLMRYLTRKKAEQLLLAAPPQPLQIESELPPVDQLQISDSPNCDKVAVVESEAAAPAEKTVSS